MCGCKVLDWSRYLYRQHQCQHLSLKEVLLHLLPAERLPHHVTRISREEQSTSTFTTLHASVLWQRNTYFALSLNMMRMKLLPTLAVFALRLCHRRNVAKAFGITSTLTSVRPKVEVITQSSFLRLTMERSQDATSPGPASSPVKPITPKNADEAVPSTWNQALCRFFLGDIGPPFVLLSIAGFLYTRLRLGPMSISDAAIFSCVVLFWWIQEYFIHRVLLHSQFDWPGKSIHQNHHDKHYFHVSIDPPELLLGWLLAAHFIMKSIFPWHLCLTATIGYAIAGLVYEWSHFIVHTKVKPPPQTQQSSPLGCVSSTLSKLFSKMRDNHIRHHLVDSSYWFAFSVPAVDDLLHTNPDVRELKRINLKK